MSTSPTPDKHGTTEKAEAVHIDHSQGALVGDHGTQSNRFTHVTVEGNALVVDGDVYIQGLDVRAGGIGEVIRHGDVIGPEKAGSRERCARDPMVDSSSEAEAESSRPLEQRAGDGAFPRRGDLVIRTGLNAVGAISISYEITSYGRLDGIVDEKSAQSIISGIGHELPRLQARFGPKSVALTEQLARQFSELFFPSEVAALARDGMVSRLCIMAEESAPNLPWELAHDGNDFLALNVPVIHATGVGCGAPPLPGERGVLVLEAVPKVYGVEPGYFMPDSRVSIRSDAMQVTRMRVRSGAEFMNAIEGSSCDLAFLEFHSTVNAQGEPIIVADEPINLGRLTSSMARSSPRLVVLDACQTASVYSDLSYGRTVAFRVASALGDRYVLGVIGWLQEETAARSSELIIHNYTSNARLEDVLLKVKRELHGQGCSQWWSYSLYGPV
jgi:hypothetical protein